MAYEQILPNLISLFLMLSVISLIYKDNPLFKSSESVLIGAMAGNYVMMSMIFIRENLLLPLAKGNIAYIFVLLLGLAMFGRFTKWPWLARYPVAIMVGTGVGVSLRATIDAQLISQVVATMLPLTTPDLFTNISNLIFILGTLVSFFYFVFTIELKGPLIQINKIGRFFLMMTFGAGVAGILFSSFASLGTTFLFIQEYLGNIFG